MRLLFGQDDAVAGWVAARIPHVGDLGFGACKAIGVVGASGVLAAGLVYHDYQPRARTIQLSMAADSPRWATKQVIRLLLFYPFEELGLNKVWTATPHTNTRALKFNKGVGFVQEGVLRHQFGPGEHAVICGMLRKDYLRLVERLTHGQAQSTKAA